MGAQAFAELGVLILRLTFTSRCSNVVHPQLVASEMLVVGKALGELFKVWLVVALATGPAVVAEVLVEE